MALRRLWENFGGSWEDFGAAGEQWQSGNHFTVSFQTTASELSWYRYSTSGPPPTVLQLWNADAKVLLYDVPSVPDSGSAGWQRHTMNSPVQLSPGITYAIIWHQVLGMHYAKVQNASYTNPPAPLQWVAPSRYYQQAAVYTFPTGSVDDVRPGMDIQVDDQGVTEGTLPPTLGELQNALASWLSEDDVTHADSAPVLNAARLEANGIDAAGTLGGKVDGLTDELTNGDHGLAAISANIGDAIGAGWDSATDTLHQIRNAITTVNSTINTIAAGVATTLERWSQELVDTLEGAAQFLAHPDRGPLGALTNTTPVPGTGWAMVGEADFDDCDVITVQAHLIVVDFSAFPVEIRQHNVCGVPIRYRLGWWCPANGEFMGERRFIDFEKMHLQDGGRLMNGALIVCKPGTSGHWQAWLLS